MPSNGLKNASRAVLEKRIKQKEFWAWL